MDPRNNAASAGSATLAGNPALSHRSQLPFHTCKSRSSWQRIDAVDEPAHSRQVSTNSPIQVLCRDKLARRFDSDCGVPAARFTPSRSQCLGLIALGESCRLVPDRPFPFSVTVPDLTGVTLLAVCFFSGVTIAVSAGKYRTGQAGAAPVTDAGQGPLPQPRDFRGLSRAVLRQQKKPPSRFPPRRRRD